MAPEEGIYAMRLNLAVCSLAVMLCVSGCVGIPGAKAQSAAVSNLTEVTATVETIDQTTRTVLLSGPRGGLLTVKVGPEVKNLAQVKPGDRVLIRYREALAAKIVPASGTAPPVEAGAGQMTAPPGHKPAGVAANMIRARVTIISVDPKRNEVSFVGPSRIERTAYVRAPEMQRLLRSLKPGDQVEVTYTEAVAVSVQPAGG